MSGHALALCIHPATCKANTQNCRLKNQEKTRQHYMEFVSFSSSNIIYVDRLFQPIQVEFGMQRVSYLVYCQPVRYVTFIGTRLCYFTTENQTQKFETNYQRIKLS
jgi:hypothetical protein